MTKKPKRPPSNSDEGVPGMIREGLIDPNDPIYGELVAPCRCVYPHCCFCTADQKARRTVS